MEISLEGSTLSILIIICIVNDSVQNGIRQRTVCSAKLIVPFGMPVLGAENRRRLFPSQMQQLENILLFIRCWFEQHPLINDEQNRICIFLDGFEIVAFISCDLKVYQQIRQTNIFRPVILFAGFHSEGTSHVSFAAAGCTCNEQITVFGNIFTGCKPFNERLVKLAAGSIDYGNRLYFRPQASQM